MDDILVHGKDKESHDAALKAVLTRLQTSGLTLNKKKCEFYKSSLTFLGYVIDGVGVKPDGNKVKAIRNLPDPTYKSDLRRLNGMLNQLAKSKCTCGHGFRENSSKMCRYSVVDLPNSYMLSIKLIKHRPKLYIKHRFIIKFILEVQVLALI